MENDTPLKLSDWIAQFDSHGIYAGEGLNDCPADIACVPLHTADQQMAAIKARGLGGSVAITEELTFVGYQMAEALATQALGETGSWGRYHGRGSRFRACIEDLRAAGL